MIGEGITVGGWLVPETELEERFDPHGGAGGQHANRNLTAVTLRFDIATSSLPEPVRERLLNKLGPAIEVTAAETRSQWRNRRRARERLIAALEEALEQPRPRRKTKPTRQSKERRLRQKRARGELKRSRRPPDVE